MITVNGDHLATRNAAGQGYVDNLSFTISSDAIDAPAPPKPPVAHVPHFDHVFVVMMENEDYDEIIGNNAAPYINSLLPKGANLTNMYATAHPSDENYTAFAAGSTGSQEGNTRPRSSTTSRSATSSATLAARGGATRRAPTARVTVAPRTPTRSMTLRSSTSRTCPTTRPRARSMSSR